MTNEELKFIEDKRVGYFHVRYEKTLESGEEVINNNGGITYAYVEGKGNSWHYAAARCHPNDNFCRKTGRIKSYCRLKGSWNSVDTFNGTHEELIAFLFAKD